MNDNNPKYKKLAYLTIPVLISEFLEEVLILTDSILLSYKPPIYLASVGIVDALLLIILSFGVALNDSYQNYFARNYHRSFSNVINVFKTGWNKFFYSGCIISLSVTLLTAVAIRVVDNNDIILYVGEGIWYLFPLAVFSYLSMWLNSFLMGLGQYRILAAISIICVITNGLLGYLLLFVWDYYLSPTSIVLVTSGIAELLGVLIMSVYVVKKYHLHKQLSTSLSHKKLLSKIFISASVYPAISEIGFHCGSLILFIFSAYYLPQYQIALLTLIFSYWGLLQIPVDGIQEIALNYFAEIHSKKEHNYFSVYSKTLINFSRICCIVLFCVIIPVVICVETCSPDLIIGIVIVFVISLLACGTEIFNTSLTARLKNDSYMTSKLIFGAISSILILAGRFILKIENIYVVLLPFLLAQLAENIYSSQRAKYIWEKREISGIMKD